MVDSLHTSEIPVLGALIKVIFTRHALYWYGVTKLLLLGRAHRLDQEKKQCLKHGLGHFTT